MAQPCTRTPTDDLSDAHRQIEDAERELANWKAHLVRAAQDPSYALILQAQRSGRIVRAAVIEAYDSTCDATSRLAGSPPSPA